MEQNIISNKLGTPTNEVPLENITLPEISEKEETIKRGKRKFQLMLFILLGLIGTVILSIVLIKLIQFIQLNNKKNFETTEPPIVIIEENPQESWIQYDNPKIKIKFKYPNNAKLIENKNFEGDIRNAEIIYSPKAMENIDGTSLIDGFVFRITPLSITKIDLDSVTTVKRESFYAECGPNVEISSSRPTMIDGLDARTFDVRNCTGDFNVTYTNKFGLFYEIVQLYRGDVGFRQQYMNTTEEMVKSISFYPDEIVIESPFQDFYNNNYNLKFIYPKELSSDCCIVANPTQNAVKIITLGVKESENKQGVFGIYAERKKRINNEIITFDKYVQEQKNNLISDYKIVNDGKEPTIVEELIKIGGMSATRFKGLSWKGNDVIFINVTSTSNYFYSISIDNSLGEGFENILNDIFNSMTFKKR